MGYRGGLLRARCVVVVVTVAALSGALLGSITPAGADVTPYPDPSASLSPNATWLETLNAWRAASHLDPVTENTDWSAGDLAHSTYMVETGDFGHDEDAGGPFATVDGAAAGLTGNVAASSSSTRTDRSFIEQWITAPFHAAGMLDPLLTTTGFGSYRKVGGTPWGSAATLDVIRGRAAGPPTLPVTFPGNEATVPAAQLAYHGGESPDPLAPCAGYNPGGGQPINTGLPLFVLLPDAAVADTVTATLTRQAAPVDVCVYDESTYANPDPDAQTLGRQVLQGRHQVVVIPREPLSPGSIYVANVSYTDPATMTPVAQQWSFIAKPEVSIGNASIVEGNTGRRSVRVTVSLSGPTTNPVTVDYATAPGTATDGSDYVAKSGTITFAPGATAAAISIPVKGDRLVEPNEAFKVKLSNPQNADFRRRSGGVSILNDDRATPVTGVRMSIGAASIVEGNADVRGVKFTVALSEPAATAVSVHFDAVPGTATAVNPKDFRAASGDLTLPAGATTGVVSIRVVGNAVVEPNETFTVQLSAAVGATIDRAIATGTILNDD
ncbi:MAG: Calx-beta domain-containing protein [Acidimicrobiia bacterium]